MNYLLSTNSQVNHKTELHETVSTQQDQEPHSVLLAEDIQTMGKSSSAGQRRLRTETVNRPSIQVCTNELIDVLIKYGNNPDGIPALHYAIKCQDEKVVRLLLEHGADPNSQSRPQDPVNLNGNVIGEPLTALDFAAAYGMPEIITVLLDNGANINISSGENQYFITRHSPLHFALKKNNLGNIRTLIERGADKYCSALMQVNFHQSSCLSAIQLASLLGNVDALRLLLKSKEDAGYALNEYDSNTPIALAVQSGSVDAVRFLLEMQALPNAGCFRTVCSNHPEKAEKTIYVPHILISFYYLAFSKGNDFNSIFSVLLDYGLDINMKDQSGNNLLSNLLWYYETAGIDEDKRKSIFSSIEAILKRGADVEAKNYSGGTAFDWAKSSEVKELLRKYGAKG